jgi:GNAT superfamily N-acetyltransferase
MTFRFADARDVPLLAEANARLLEDERHEMRLSSEELVERWSKWLAGEYRAVLFEEESPVAYALFRPSETGVYLRQFFVWRGRRRQGRGRAAFALLATQVWAPGTRIELDVLCGNQTGLRFWKTLGFRDYAVRMELRT